MKKPAANIADGPWPSAVAQQLASHGILRWQVLKRHYEARPEALTEIVPGTSTQNWADWLSRLPPVWRHPEREYAMGLIPNAETADNEGDQKEANREDEDDSARLG
jgi:hypothetical protein